HRERAAHHDPLSDRVAQAPELLVVVQELPRDPVERGADEERPREGLPLIAQAGWDEGPVEHRAAPSRFVGENRRLLAPQQRIGALPERQDRRLIQDVAELLLERQPDVVLRHLQAIADVPLDPLRVERSGEPHRAHLGGRDRSAKARPPGPTRARIIGCRLASDVRRQAYRTGLPTRKSTRRPWGTPSTGRSVSAGRRPSARGAGRARDLEPDPEAEVPLLLLDVEDVAARYEPPEDDRLPDAPGLGGHQL